MCLTNRRPPGVRIPSRGTIFAAATFGYRSSSPSDADNFRRGTPYTLSRTKTTSASTIFTPVSHGIAPGRELITDQCGIPVRTQLHRGRCLFGLREMRIPSPFTFDVHPCRLSNELRPSARLSSYVLYLATSTVSRFTRSQSIS